MKKAISPSSAQRAQLEAQQHAQSAALSHQLHLQSIQTLGQILAIPTISESLKEGLERSITSLLEPFLPQTPIIK